MLDFGFYCMDCMAGMQEFPDKYFDLAIVDPVYGGVTQGGYMTNRAGFRYVGFEIDRGYFDAARGRLEAAIAQVSMFGL